ncbi:MAG: hypothetical protein WCF56_21110 [Pseudolabrys sp.]
MKKVLVFAAVAEVATGLALLTFPSFVGQLLLDEPIPVARVAGIALVALGIACWPGPPLIGMLAYSTIVALYLANLGFAGSVAGVLLWPAVVLHAILTALLTWASAREKKTNTQASKTDVEPNLHFGA